MTATGKELARLFGDWDGFFQPGVHVPGVKIQKNSEEYKISIPLPGVKKDQVEIKVEDGTLHISGKRVSEADGYETVRSEVADYVEFSRSLSIRSSDFDLDRIDAKMSDGVLEVKLPLAEKTKPRQISIKAE